MPQLSLFDVLSWRLTQRIYVHDLFISQEGAKAQYTGGRHGYGAKLTNIFSKQFSVETVDTEQGLRYFQEWTDNMTNRTDPKIKEIDAKKVCHC